MSRHYDVTSFCDTQWSNLRFIGLFFQSVLVEYIGVCTDTNEFTEWFDNLRTIFDLHCHWNYLTRDYYVVGETYLNFTAAVFSNLYISQACNSSSFSKCLKLIGMEYNAFGCHFVQIQIVVHYISRSPVKIEKKLSPKHQIIWVHNRQKLFFNNRIS